MGKRLVQLIKLCFEGFSEIVFPFCGRCLCCESISINYLCSKCSSKISYVKTPYYINLCESSIKIKCYSVAYYSHSFKKLLLKFKYKGNFNCSDYFVSQMKECIERNNIHFDIISYVPSTKKIVRKRGFNQSEVLALKLAEALNKKCCSLLMRKEGAMEQKKLSREDRLNNLKGIFSVKDEFNIKNKKILLIDDVFTTGATVYHCSEQLLSKDVFEVIILTLAKSNV